jgi:hypothetical protein
LQTLSVSSKYPGSQTQVLVLLSSYLNRDEEHFVHVVELVHSSQES